MLERAGLQNSTDQHLTLENEINTISTVLKGRQTNVVPGMFQVVFNLH